MPSESRAHQVQVRRTVVMRMMMMTISIIFLHFTSIVEPNHRLEASLALSTSPSLAPRRQPPSKATREGPESAPVGPSARLGTETIPPIGPEYWLRRLVMKQITLTAAGAARNKLGTSRRQAQQSQRQPPCDQLPSRLAKRRSACQPPPRDRLRAEI